MKHKRKKLITMVLCFVLMINSGNTSASASEVGMDESSATEGTTENYWPEGPEISAGAAVVMDVNTGVVLYEKNGEEKHYPASITKILTALLAIENASLSDKVTFSKEAVFNVEYNSSSCGIDWGEILTLEDCLYGMMLVSGNEVANAIAENIGGTYDHFIEMMNEKAEELGCVNSHFVNPHGLFNEEHWTCAYDMALIGRAAIQNTAFAKITGTRSHTMGPTNKQEESRTWVNKHGFVKKSTYKYDGCIGGKTGYTQKAKHTLATFAKRGNMTLVCIIMDEEGVAEQYKDTAALLDYGFDQFSVSKISDLDGSKILEDSLFFDQYSSVLSAKDPMLKLGEDSYVLLPNGVDLSNVKKEINYYEKMSLENTRDMVKEIGKVTFTYNNKTIGTGSILLDSSEGELPVTIHSMINSENADSNVGKTKEKEIEQTEKKDKKNLKPLIITIIIGSILIVVLLYYFTIERKRIKRRKAYLARRRNNRYY